MGEPYLTFVIVSSASPEFWRYDHGRSRADGQPDRGRILVRLRDGGRDRGLEPGAVDQVPRHGGQPDLLALRDFRPGRVPDRGLVAALVAAGLESPVRGRAGALLPQ